MLEIRAMEYFIGIALAIAVCGFATLVGLDRERAFFPTVAIVVASYYALFAVMGGAVDTLVPEIIGVAAFVLLAVLGYRVNLWYVAAALAAHGIFDAFHGGLITNPGVPAWWPGFCMTFDVVVAAWLVAVLLGGRVPAAAQRFALRIRPHVDAELALARARMAEGCYAIAFGHLERAHVLGQRSTREHVRVHWHMLVWALRERRLPEIGSQAFRIVGAALLSAIDLVPDGNTGGGDVSAFRRMAVPRDLAEIIAAARVQPP
jgi:hypothetical protein